MSEIKSTPGPYHISGTGRHLHIGSQHSPMVLASLNEVHVDTPGNALLFSAAPDMAEVLEMIAADADAGEILMTSGIRLAIDAALIKAGRKAAPEPVRVVTIAGMDRAADIPLPDPAQVAAESPDWIKNALPPEGA
ncbi:hypothetical protein ABEG10_23245 [Burkholderia cenocepacia]|uniref:hypothetical protein n=1 Tax=Burkholderia cenocepacia TaxID=95486 RepID=UPI00209EC9E0|nr:hypothetical protein [Burkholderia cenocepacia]MCO8325941.1 hypothetical protein [Burkholderia cenocepacia]MCO8333011.1 hypothetical protein [Burkholderia cenocepacia]MCO8340511.1 hypothetical protein [Burkholderia cenocepacia]MCO8347797.1 hypothetical protein [Burkholderia cenocepacia]MCO8360863.1 hypothetical protein [Burkholderia cenocepacia]